MATLDMQQIGSYAYSAGFTDRNKLATAIAIAWAESGGRTDVINYLGCTGLWQVYVRVHISAHPTWTTSAMQQPYNNARAAYELSSGGSNWKPWETYTNGMYKQYMGPAATAADKVLASKTTTTSSNTPPPSGPSLEKTMSWFAQQIGYVSDAGTKYWNLTQPSLNGQPWCGAFVTAGLKANGIDLKALGCSNPYYCPTIVNWAKSTGRWTQTPKPGYLVLFSWSGGPAEHVEIVEKVISSKDVVCIGGNTSNNARGSQNNGMGVWRNERKSGILGYVKLDYAPTAAPQPTANYVGQTEQQVTTKLVVDETGIWDQKTADELARHSKMPMPVTSNWAYWRYIEEWTGLEGKYLDGDLDYVTIQMLQWRTNQDVIDGKWNARTVLGVQQYLNAQAIEDQKTGVPTA